MSNQTIDLVPKDGVFRADIGVQKTQDLSNPARINNKREIVQYLTLEEMNKVLDNMPESRDKLFIRLIWMTGVRVTEAINLEKRHINQFDRQAKIRWLKNRKNYERYIPIPRALLDILLTYSAAMSHDERLFPFTRQRAEQITKDTLGVSPHKLRHSYAMNYMRQRKDPNALRELQRLLGHATLRTTMQYLHLSNADLQEPINEIQY